MSNLALYALTVLFWGTSWIAITFQLGVVAPAASLVYRFLLSALLMALVCAAGRRDMRFTLGQHGFMALQGLLLFSTNFFLVYLGTQYLTSGLVAVAFSSIVVFNIVGGRVLFGDPIRARVVAGAGLGLTGIGLIFWPEVEAFQAGGEAVKGLVLTLAGSFTASLGMLTSARNQRRGLPVIQTNTFGMIYGTLFMAGYGLLNGTPFTFDGSFAYVASLLYLAVFATVIGFWTYLTLLGRIGAGRAAYVTVMFPVVALLLSSAFEDFHWSAAAASGLALVLLGNTLVLTKTTVLAALVEKIIHVKKEDR